MRDVIYVKLGIVYLINQLLIETISRKSEGVWNPLPEPEPVLKTHYQIFFRWPNVTNNDFILDFLGYLYDALHKQCLV